MKILDYDIPLGISLAPCNAPSVQPFAEAGFSHFEICLPASAGTRGGEDEFAVCSEPFRNALHACALRPWSVHLPFGTGWDIAHIDEQERGAVCESLKKIIGLAGAWGAKICVLHGCLEPVVNEHRPVRIARSIKSMRALDEHARGYGMRVALENLPRSCLGNCAAEVFAMMHAAGDVPVCFDVNHLLMEDHAAFLDVLAPHVATTHLSDYDAVDERHWLPGRGVVPWRLVVERLQAAGYRGPYLFELARLPDGTVYPPAEVCGAFRRAVEEGA